MFYTFCEDKRCMAGCTKKEEVLQIIFTLSDFFGIIFGKDLK